MPTGAVLLTTAGFTRRKGSGMASVRLVNVTKRYGEIVAVDRVNLTVENGEFITLLGPSGCGKTTTLRMIAGLVEPSEGEIYFDDELMNAVPVNRRNVGFVFQSHALFPHMTVQENLAFGLKARGFPKQEIKKRIQEVLHLVEMVGFEKRKPHQLSGGQQQRISLARVLVGDPTVLLFDEPLSSLDFNLRNTLKFQIKELQRRTRKTAIYVTHDQSEAFAISDRIVVMDRGRIQQIGTQLDIYLRPQTPVVANFIGSHNCFRGILTEWEPESGLGVLDCEGLLLKVRMSEGYYPRATQDSTPHRVLAYLRPEEIEILDHPENEAYLNCFRGRIQQVIFEGSTLRVYVEVADRILQAEVSGKKRLSFFGKEGLNVYIGFSDLTLIREKE
ncbi:MAG TPA: ABC transporter ATP-binding protein [Candidatus Limnocylindrales bacterium]|nr:ABC transporter ATP-binding protein [Candidatus Limnocylindrales bacterium]